MKDKALVIVDEQRGFMPAEEGLRLDEPGFGELTVPNGHLVVAPTNSMTETFLTHSMPVITTQDMHPSKTAHFSENPNFIDTWLKHCVAGTAGSELHPDLMAATDRRVAHFIKGDVAAKTPAEDNSYTGALAHRTIAETNEEELLPDYLRKLQIATVYICGLTIGLPRPLCVDSTALDLQEQGFNVVLVTNAIEAVVPEDREECFKHLGAKGIRLANSHQAVAEAAATYEVIR